MKYSNKNVADDEMVRFDEGSLRTRTPLTSRAASTDSVIDAARFTAEHNARMALRLAADKGHRIAGLMSVHSPDLPPAPTLVGMCFVCGGLLLVEPTTDRDGRFATGPARYNACRVDRESGRAHWHQTPGKWWQLSAVGAAVMGRSGFMGHGLAALMARDKATLDDLASRLGLPHGDELISIKPGDPRPFPRLASLYLLALLPAPPVPEDDADSVAAALGVQRQTLFALIQSAADALDQLGAVGRS